MEELQLLLSASQANGLERDSPWKTFLAATSSRGEPEKRQGLPDRSPPDSPHPHLRGETEPLQLVPDIAEHVRDLATEERDRKHSGDGDQREDQRVFGEGLPLF